MVLHVNPQIYKKKFLFRIFYYIHSLLIKERFFLNIFCFKLLIKVLICENEVFPKYRQRNQSGMHRIDEYAWHFGLAGKPTARTFNVPDNHNYFFLLYLCHHRYCEISQACPSNHINKYYYHIRMQGKN